MLLGPGRSRAGHVKFRGMCFSHDVRKPNAPAIAAAGQKTGRQKKNRKAGDGVGDKCREPERGSNSASSFHWIIPRSFEIDPVPVWAPVLQLVPLAVAMLRQQCGEGIAFSG